MQYGARITFFEGVESYFDRINQYAAKQNIHLEH